MSMWLVSQHATASEAKGWLSTQEKQCDGLGGPAPRWMPLADVFCLPEEARARALLG